MKKIFTLISAALFAANVMAAGDDNVVRYDFENYRLVDVPDSEFKYYGWYELNEDATENELWASGNPAFTIALLFSEDKTPEAFPTVAVKEGYDGACVKLETKSTGALAAALYGMGIAAGNLFTGSFDTNNAVEAPMQATQFGKPFYKKPVKFTGYYKYAAGATTQDGKGNAVDFKDQGQIYSVLYRNTDAEGNPVVLNGENILTSENIVAVADAGDITDIADWTQFNADFKYKEGKEIDDAILAAGGYSLATVFTSSINGAKFIGAVGSTLYVDKVAIEYETNTKKYTDNLVVKLNGDEAANMPSSIFVTKQDDGKYTLALNNFFLGTGADAVAVGNITIKDVEASSEGDKVILKSSQNIVITEGDTEGVPFWLGPSLGEVPVSLNAEMTNDKLYAEINISFMGMEIAVVFGTNPTGIQDAFTAGSDNAQEIYTIDGAKVSNMQSGKVYIVRKANGKTVKVIKK